MSSASEIRSLALKLSGRSRLKLANGLLWSVNPVIALEGALAEASGREAEIESDEVKPLHEDEFWSGIKRAGLGRK